MSASVPPSGGVQGRDAPRANPSLPPAARYHSQLEAMMGIAWAIGSTLEVDALLPRIMEKVTEVMRADRSTFFVVDVARGELWSKVVQGQASNEIRLKLGDGVAGWVAETGEAVNLTDAYEDPRFDRSWDRQTGYRTRSLLCVPIRDRNENVIAVIQCLNKQRRDFDAEDEELLGAIGGQCAIAMEAALMHRSLLEQRETAERAERLVLLGHSVSAILHDLRTPMAAVSGFAELLAAEPDPATRADYAARIERALAHMEAMTQETLAFARGQREILVRKVYLNQFIESVREMLVPETEAFGVTLDIDARYDGLAHFDESKLKRVLFNLARNACQAMGSGGRFRWCIDQVDDKLSFECSDTGPGIAPEMESRLFESFASHAKTGGTGLGLAMAKKFVDAHRGTIECTSAPGAGATFRILLPL